MLVAAINLELGAHLAAQLGLGQHALDRFFDNLFRTALEQAHERLFAQAAGETGIAAIKLLLALQPGQPHLLGIDHDHVIAHIDERARTSDSFCRSARLPLRWPGGPGSCHWRPPRTTCGQSRARSEYRSTSLFPSPQPCSRDSARPNITCPRANSSRGLKIPRSLQNAVRVRLAQTSNLWVFRVHNPVRQTGRRRLRNQFRLREFGVGVNNSAPFGRVRFRHPLRCRYNE